MKIPRPVLVALVVLALFALFMFLNDQPVRVRFLVTSATLPSWGIMLISFCFGVVPGLALGVWAARPKRS